LSISIKERFVKYLIRSKSYLGIDQPKEFIVTFLSMLYIFFVHFPVSEFQLVNKQSIIILFLLLFIYYDLIKIKYTDFSILSILLLFLFFLYAFISITWSFNFNYGLYKLLGYSFDIIPTIFLSVILFSSPGYLNSKNILLASQLIGLGLFLLLFMQGGLNFWDKSKNIFEFGHIGYGRFLGFAFLIGIYYSLTKFRGYKLIILSNSVILTGLVLSGHRSSLLGALFFAFVLFIYSLISKKFRTKTVILHYLSIFSLAVLFLYFIPIKFHESFSRNQNLLIKSYNDIQSDGSFNARLLLIDYSINAISKSPILGVGLGGFNSPDVLKNHSGILKYPHNLILEIFTEQGAIGLLLFSSILIMLLSKLPNEILIWLILLYGVWLSMFYGVLSDHKLVFIFFYFFITRSREISQCKVLRDWGSV